MHHFLTSERTRDDVFSRKSSTNFSGSAKEVGEPTPFDSFSFRTSVDGLTALAIWAEGIIEVSFLHRVFTTISNSKKKSNKISWRYNKNNGMDWHQFMVELKLSPTSNDPLVCQNFFGIQPKTLSRTDHCHVKKERNWTPMKGDC